MTNITSECRSANIVRDHATILPDDATPKPDGIFGKDTRTIQVIGRASSNFDGDGAGYIIFRQRLSRLIERR